MSREREPEPREAAPAPVEAPRISVGARTTARCPYCHADLAPERLAARCVACETAHHPTCFDEHGSCSVHGCGGKVARVGILGGKTDRAILGPCLACQATVYLDENVAVCAACESFHHPGCLETRGSCARCGACEATLIAAGAYQRSLRTRGGRSFSGPVAIVATVVIAVAALVVFVSFDNPLVALILGVLALLEAIVAVHAMRRRRE